jgi:hypothetical protein
MGKHVTADGLEQRLDRVLKILLYAQAEEQ